MHDDRADAGVDPGQQPLRLAEAVGEQQAGAAGVGIGAPPVVDFAQHLGLRAPAVDGQAKRAFGDEAMAAHGLERRTGGVAVFVDAAQEVVAARHPHLPAMLDAHLRRAEHVAGGVQAHAHAVDLDPLAILEPLQHDVVAQPRAQHTGADGGGEIGAVAAPRMVGVGVRDHCALDRPPRVDVEAARRAVQALGAQDDEVLAHWRSFALRTLA